MHIRNVTWLAVLTMYGGVAFGQPSNPRVSAILRRGVQLRQQGQDEAALLEFRRALAISSEPRITAQIALAEQGLQRWPDADRHLREALSASQDDYIVRHRAVLEAALGEVGRHLGSVLVTGGVAGAEVRVNGESIGTLPMEEAVRVRPGEVRIEVRAAGFAMTTRNVTVAAGGTVREQIVLSSSRTTVRSTTDRNVSIEPSRGLVNIGTVARPSTGSTQRTWGWITLVSGVVLIGGGVTGLVMHDGIVTDFNNRGCYVPPGSTVVMGPRGWLGSCVTYHDSITGTLGIVGLAGGGVLAALSVVLLATAPSQTTESARHATRFGCGQGPGQFGIACTGTF